MAAPDVIVDRSVSPRPRRRRRPPGGWPFYGCRYRGLGSVDAGGCHGVFDHWTDDGDPVNRGLQYFTQLHPDPAVREGLISNYQGFITEEEAQEYADGPQTLFPEKTRKDFETLANMLITVITMAGLMLVLNLGCEWYGCNRFNSIGDLLASSFSTDIWCNGCVKGRAFILDQQLLAYGLLFTAGAACLGQTTTIIGKNGLKLCGRCCCR